MANLQTLPVRPVGAAPDLSPPNAPPDFYNFAQNVVFDEDKARRQQGYSYRDPAPIFKPEALQYHRVAGTDQWLYAGADGIGLDVGTQFDVTPAGYVVDATPALRNWTSLNDVPVHNHPEMVPYFHDGVTSNPMQPIPAWPAGWYCNRMVAFKFFLMALGGGDAGGEINDQIRWSSSADPGLLPAEWIPTAENDAGDTVIGEPEGAILDAIPLRDNLIVYKGASTHMLQYVGTPSAPFVQRTIYPNSGILSAGCAAEYKGRHFVVTQGDVIVHDGARAESIADGQARKFIFDNMSGALINRAFAYVDAGALCFCFCYPSGEAVNWCDRRARYSLGKGPDAGRWTFEVLRPDETAHVGIGKYTQSGIGGTWDEDTAEWNSKVGRWSDGAVEAIGDQALEAFPDAGELGQPTSGGQRGSLTPVSELTWLSKAINPGRAILVDHVWPIIDNPGSVTLRMQFGVQEDYDAPIDWSDEMVADAGRGVDVGLRTRLFSVRVRAEAVQDFSIAGFDIDWRDAGRW